MAQSTADQLSGGAPDAGAHGHSAEHSENPYLAHHFDNPRHQFESGKLGIWLFLVTEVLFFGGLFCAYAIYRSLHPEIFVWAHYYLDTFWGALNTGVLIVSSLTAAWAVRNAQLGEQKKLIINIIATIGLAFCFLCVKYVEYSHKFHENVLPGRHFNPTYEAWESKSYKKAHGEHAGPVTGHGAESPVAGSPVAGSPVAGSPVAGSPVAGSPVAGSPVAGSPVAGSPVAGSPVAGSPVAGSPVAGSPVAGSPVAGSPVAGSPVAGSPVATGVAAGAAAATAAPSSAQPAPAAAKQPPPGAPERPHHVSVFFSIYFFMTGLHGVHVVAGIITWLWILRRAVRGEFGPKHFGAVDYAALYWHLVDLIWIYLFPLLYLIH